MARRVSIGHQNFETIRENDFFYIDKTDFIRQWWERGDSVTLITRPRRFGKTLNMSMLEHFFSIRYAGRSDLFEGLAVWADERCRQLQGTYPVLFLSFADVKTAPFAEARKNICMLIHDLYNQNRFLLEGDLLDNEEKARFKCVDAEMPDSIAASSLRTLMEYLYRYYGKKVILLMDEYDTPMQEAYVNGFWREMVSFIRVLFNSTFKTNPFLERGMMTGITRVSKESVFSDLNNLNVVTGTSREYAECFGFTEQEVFAALDEYGMSDRKEKVKEWYDGFVFGGIPDIYNPWSILNFLDKKKFEAYWANTSSNSLVGQLVRQGSRAIKQDFEELLAGESIVKPIDEQIVFNQLDKSDDAVWSLLLASGYLKVLSVDSGDAMEEEQPMYRLALPNGEVRRMFKRIVSGWFGRAAADYNDFLKALLLDDVDEMNEYMNRVALATFSYFDVAGRPGAEPGGEPERFYHGFVLGLMVDLADRYTVTSNRESGFGCYDIMLEPKDRERDDAIIIEFKVRLPKREKDLEETVRNALAQIDEMRYEEALVSKGCDPARIRKYGFAFEGKTVLIGE